MKKDKDNLHEKRRFKMNIAYLGTLAAVFSGITLAMIILPRSTVSLVENRELTEFPEFSEESYFSGEFTETISKWFSDTVPFRDNLTELSAALQSLKGFRMSAGGSKPPVGDTSDTSSPSSDSPDNSSGSQSSSESTTDNTASSPGSSGTSDGQQSSSDSAGSSSVSQPPDSSSADSTPGSTTESTSEIPPQSSSQQSSSPSSSSSASQSSASTVKPKPPEPEVTPPVIDTTNALIQPVSPPAGAVDLNGAVSFGKNNVVTVGTRAFELYKGDLNYGKRYAEVLNKYKAALGDSVNVYSMVVPTACEFYSPPALDGYRGSALDNINNIIANLNGIKAVDVYTPLALHADEKIYLRTDHHWSPLGAYYGARAFAEAAQVPFMDLSKYERRVTYDFVGTMYAFSGDYVIKNNPEDFVYYVPSSLNYTTTYFDYVLKNNRITGMYPPYQDKFFFDYMDGSPNAYLTFMKGDAKIVNVKTNVNNGRRLAIFKDSYGNSLSGYLFDSFEEIYILDFRYFTHNAIDFMKENKITDLLFINNAFFASGADDVRSVNASAVECYETNLTQSDWGL